MSQEFINKITIDYLVNTDYLNNQNNGSAFFKVKKKDKKFYKKRIYDLTKNLLLNQNTNDLNPSIKYAFDNYINICISHFKTIDNNDIIQNDYNGIKNNNENNDNENNNNENNYIKNSDINNSTTINDNNQEIEVNNILMRNIKKIPNLDNFVKKKTVEKDNIILPKQKNIDLKNPNLKNKGIRKKNNIVNKYEDNKE